MKSSTFEIGLRPLLSHSPSVKNPSQHFNVFCHNSLKKSMATFMEFPLTEPHPLDLQVALNLCGIAFYFLLLFRMPRGSRYGERSDH